MGWGGGGLCHRVRTGGWVGGDVFGREETTVVLMIVCGGKHSGAMVVLWCMRVRMRVDSTRENFGRPERARACRQVE